MDTSAGRYAVAVLMEGRLGMVCDIMAERIGTSKPTSINTSHETSGPSTPGSIRRNSTSCICQETPITQEPPIEEGTRSIYRSIGHSDDPPRSVALCPQRSCVAFGCSYGIELHWVDALTGQDLSRWFPLSSPSDFLYFLPARKGVDTGKKLRLISSAAVLGLGLGPDGNMFRSFLEMNNRPPLSTAIVSVVDTVAGRTRVEDVHSLADLPSQRAWVRPHDLLDQQLPSDGAFRRVSANASDHYRAVPLGDGYHILFTDPKNGNLCLGTDAPVGSLNRLIRKVWFRPPAGAISPLPVLYTAGSDTRHGVRVIVTFSVRSGDSAQVGLDDEGGASQDDPLNGKNENHDKQMIVFYTIPPDVFHDISRSGSLTVQRSLIATAEDDSGEEGSKWVDWWPEAEGRQAVEFGDPFWNNSVYPLEVQGQPVAIYHNLVEVALDSGPDMILWAFSAEGWARAWALRTGRWEGLSRTMIQRDGSLRLVDPDGNFVMAGVEHPDVSDNNPRTSNLPPFDGPATVGTQVSTPWSPRVEECRRLLTGCRGGRTSGTLSVDVVEEISGIARMDVELR